MATECDRLDKIQYLIEKLHESMQQTFVIGKEMVIDESMVPCHGRLSFGQYLAGKWNKYGSKIFIFCSVDGYWRTVKF